MPDNEETRRAIISDLGPVSAYAAALEGGYVGSKDSFNYLLAHLGDRDGVFFINGDQSEPTDAWTGYFESIYGYDVGTTFVYRLPYASVGENPITLYIRTDENLDDEDTPGSSESYWNPVYGPDGTPLRGHFDAGTMFILTRYDGAWRLVTASSSGSGVGGNGISFVVGTQEEETSSWTGNATDIYEITDGLTIAYYLPYDAIESENVTLQLTLKNGSETTEIPVNFKGDEPLTNQYSSGSILILTYYDGAWRRSEYDSDRNTHLGAVVRGDYSVSGQTGSVIDPVVILAETDGAFSPVGPGYSMIRFEYSQTFSHLGMVGAYGSIYIRFVDGSLTSENKLLLVNDLIGYGHYNHAPITIPSGSYLMYYDGVNTFYIDTEGNIPGLNDRNTHIAYSDYTPGEGASFIPTTSNHFYVQTDGGLIPSVPGYSMLRISSGRSIDSGLSFAIHITSGDSYLENSSSERQFDLTINGKTGTGNNETLSVPKGNYLMHFDGDNTFSIRTDGKIPELADLGDIDISVTMLDEDEDPSASMDYTDPAHPLMELNIPAGKSGNPGVHIGPEAPTDPDMHIWLQPNGDSNIVGMNAEVTMLPADSIPVAEMDTVNDVLTLKLRIPKGDKGDRGDTVIIASNYEDLSFPISNGAYCLYNGVPYVSNTDIQTQEDFTVSHWDPLSFEDEIAALRPVVSGHKLILHG